LPEAVSLWGDEDEARYVVSVLEAVDWKWTPAQILDQNEALLHDVLVVGGLSGKLRQIERDQERNANA
jgi:hypothetical protein